MSLYDRSGQRISRERWEALVDDEEYRLLRRTTIGPTDDLQRYRISTAWTGIDVGHAKEPLIFLTILTGPDINREYLYSTEEEAFAGHEGIVHDLGAGVVEEHGMAEIMELPKTPTEPAKEQM